MTAHLTARLAWSLCALAVILAAVHLLLLSISGPPPESTSFGVLGGILLRVIYSLTVVLLVTMGALIALRHPHNWIGWLCLVWGLLFALEMFGSQYATSTALAPAGALLPGAVVLAWLAEMLNINVVLIVPVLLLFPDGRLPGRAWQPVLMFAAVCAATGELFVAVQPGPLGSAPAIANPLGIAGADEALHPLYLLAVSGLVLAALLAAAALALRLRHAKGDERQQLKWIAYAGVLLALGFLSGFSAPHEWTLPVTLAYFLILDGFLLTLGLAVLKYRLYDIDPVINKTLVYGALAVVITTMYVGVVVGIGTLVSTRGEPNLLLSLLATALVALAFQPLRERLQRVANRLVYGDRASPYEVLSGFSRRMAAALSVDQVLPSMAEAAARGVAAVRSRVRVYVPGGPDQAVAWPISAVAESFHQAVTVPVLHQGQPIGEIAVAMAAGEPVTEADKKLLLDLASQAGPALENVRLDLDLRASRRRIVAAQDAERRRLERDIHDGAQQQLIAVAVNVRVAQELLETDPAEANGLLAEVGEQLGEVLETLRDLARGIFPAVLADRGLASALEAQLVRSSTRAHLVADSDVRDIRLAPEVEAAAYFCCLEALQNCAKYACGAPARVHLGFEDAWLVFTVSDSGPGFDQSAGRGGTGLPGMADRLAAVGGRLEVRSRPGHGTAVSGRVPARVVAGAAAEVHRHAAEASV